MFNFNKKATSIPWNQLTDLSQIDNMKEASFTKPQIVFKHSTRCPISSMALNRFESSFKPIDADLNFLDLIRYRPVSNEVARVFSIQHESPQVLLIHKGKVIYNTSHNGIQFEALEDVLTSL
jgi:bacillithiol system protein YtxJ